MASNQSGTLPTLSVQKVVEVSAQGGILEVTLSVYAHGTAAPEGKILLTFDVDQAQILQSKFQAMVPHARRQLGQRT